MPSGQVIISASRPPLDPTTPASPPLDPTLILHGIVYPPTGPRHRAPRGSWSLWLVDFWLRRELARYAPVPEPWSPPRRRDVRIPR